MADEVGPPELGATVVEVDFKPRTGEDVEPLMRIKNRYETPGCEHTSLGRRGVIVDEELRRVTCKACGELLDPVQVLLDMAKHWRIYSGNLQQLRSELDRRTEHLEQLKREEANARARVKRLRESGGSDG